VGRRGGSLARPGFGVPGLYATAYFAKHGRVWTFLGFPTYGDGPFEDVGIHTTTPLLVAFCLVCAAEMVIGVLIWTHERIGTVLSLWLLPIELAFWIGFALPFGLIAGLARTILVLAARAPQSSRCRQIPGSPVRLVVEPLMMGAGPPVPRQSTCFRVGPGLVWGCSPLVISARISASWPLAISPERR
jgi:hypothetical protein